MADHEALATNKRATVTEISATVEQDQDEAAFGAPNVEENKHAEGLPPDHMYTHPASQSNFKYDKAQSKPGTKYQGDPKKDLQEDLQD